MRGETSLARTNYKFEKRQRELKKQKKKAEKMQRKIQKQTASPDEDGTGSAPAEGDQILRED